MTEQSFRGLVVRMLRDQGLDPISVENAVYPGTPDINYRGGWVELKILKSWPARADTPVRISCLEPQQRAWLRRRWQSGGLAFLLLRVESNWLLFDGVTASGEVGSVPKKELIALAVQHWARQPTPWDLADALMRRHP